MSYPLYFSWLGYSALTRATRVRVPVAELFFMGATIQGFVSGSLRWVYWCRVVAHAVGVFPFGHMVNLYHILFACGRPWVQSPVCPFCSMGFGDRALLLQLLCNKAKAMWPSCLRRWPKAPIRKSVGSNPTAVIFQRAVGCLGGGWRSLVG